MPRTLVFDEIDIGIGGRAAEAVGQKLKALSRTQQVLCVTHLAQIAAFADQHFLIEKRERAARTATNVRLLALGDRTEELARMMSGATVTETSRRHAEQMLEACYGFRVCCQCIGYASPIRNHDEKLAHPLCGFLGNYDCARKTGCGAP